MEIVSKDSSLMNADEQVAKALFPQLVNAE